MSEKEIAKAYEPGQHEDAIYRSWEESGFFNPDNLQGEPWTIMMPPPNVTGVLHLGHALENSLMDTMVRYQRMRGRKVLLVPGTDHAAVATQAKVEKLLQAEGIAKPREMLGRDGLLERIRQYAEESKATILKQVRKLGTSCDWSRLAYTFDDERGRAVTEVFVRMFHDGLIYRGYRVVNWSVKGQSTCSDDELVHVERPGKLYYFKYAKDFPITIATTRPETKLGDTAVAVNPADERYRQYIGQTFTVEIGAKEPLAIKVIGDEGVEPGFGTGALGVTPAHSAIDFEMYEKQKAKGEAIGFVQVIDTQGRMTEAAGEAYSGLTTIEAREKLVAWLESQGLLERVEEVTQNVGTSDRFGDVVEALPMTQWFVDVNKPIPGRNKSLKELMREAATIGHKGDASQKVTITPERFERVYLHWIDNLRDWCISRQVWWGHRIPVWYRGDEMYCGHQAPSNASALAGRPEADGWKQDEDTLDTWFSSALWTFSTLGWPDKGWQQRFHPTDWMQMGYEILFFWMARMILMSTYVLDEIPFRDVYIHGILRDEKNQKFSKSSGNNIDPLEVIAEYGTDALRLSLMGGIAPGNDSKYYVEKVEGARNLVNKLWNICRFAAQNQETGNRQQESAIEALTACDNWILARLNATIESVTRSFDSYNFSQAAETLRDFTWNDLADWYLEASKFEKTEGKEAVLDIIIRTVLKLWHPFVPFVTEAIWRDMFAGEMLMVEPWPKKLAMPLDERRGQGFELVKDLVAAIRNARSENKVEPARKVEARIYAGSKQSTLSDQAHLIMSLKTGIETLDILEAGPKIDDAIFATVNGIEIYLMGAVDKEKELERIRKEIMDKERFVNSLRAKLANEEFVRNAPSKIVENEQAKLAAAEAELSKLQAKS